MAPWSTRGDAGVSDGMPFRPELTADLAGRAPVFRAVVPLLAAYWTFGQYWGAWVVIQVDFLRAHGINEGGLGLLLMALSVVSIATMVLASPRLQPFPLSFTIPLALLTMGTGTLLVGYLPTAGLVLAFAVLGLANALIDVFVNVAGQAMEARLRKPVLQWLHASYSVGGITGALGAGLALTAGVSFRTILGIVGVLLLVVGLWNARAGSIERLPRSKAVKNKVSVSLFLHSRALLLPAFVVLFAFFVEGSMDIWSVTYLRKTLSTSVIAGAIAFAIFSLSMAIGRLTAGRLLFGLGYRRTILVSGIGSFVAGSVAALTSSTLVAGIGFLFLGFFMASAAPAAFGLVGGSGEDPTMAVSAMTTVGYSGFVIGPPIMGWLAQTAGLRATMGCMALSTIGIAMGGILTKRQD